MLCHYPLLVTSLSKPYPPLLHQHTQLNNHPPIPAPEMDRTTHAPLANPKISPPPHHKQQRMICGRNRPLRPLKTSNPTHHQAGWAQRASGNLLQRANDAPCPALCGVC